MGTVSIDYKIYKYVKKWIVLGSPPGARFSLAGRDYRQTLRDGLDAANAVANLNTGSSDSAWTQAGDAILTYWRANRAFNKALDKAAGITTKAQ